MTTYYGPNPLGSDHGEPSNCSDRYNNERRNDMSEYIGYTQEDYEDDESRKALLDFYRKLDKRNKLWLEYYLETQRAELLVLLMSPDYCTRDRIDWQDYFCANSN